MSVKSGASALGSILLGGMSDRLGRLPSFALAALRARGQRCDLVEPHLDAHNVAGDDGIQARLREEIRSSGTAPALGASLSDIVEIVRAASEGKPHASDSMAIQVPLDFAGNRLITPMLIDHCHGQNVQVHVWTINEAATMGELLDLGVDGIVTDLPGVMAHLIAGSA